MPSPCLTPAPDPPRALRTAGFLLAAGALAAAVAMLPSPLTGLERYALPKELVLHLAAAAAAALCLTRAPCLTRDNVERALLGYLALTLLSATAAARNPYLAARVAAVTVS